MKENGNTEKACKASLHALETSHYYQIYGGVQAKIQILETTKQTTCVNTQKLTP